MNQLVKTAKTQNIDKEATADHDAVASAVARSDRVALPEPEPNFSHLPDTEFREAVRKKYGFTPNI